MVLLLRCRTGVVGLVKNTSSKAEKVLGRALFMMLSMDDGNLNKNFIICGIFTLELSMFDAHEVVLKSTLYELRYLFIQVRF